MVWVLCRTKKLWNSKPVSWVNGIRGFESTWWRPCIACPNPWVFFCLFWWTKPWHTTTWIGVIWGLRKPWFTVGNIIIMISLEDLYHASLIHCKPVFGHDPRKYVFENQDFMGFLVKSNDSQLMFNQPTPPKNVMPSDTRVSSPALLRGTQWLTSHELGTS